MKKIILKIIIVITLLTLYANPAYAINPINTDKDTGNVTIESNQKIDDSIITAGNTISIKGTIEDNVFVAGSNINIDGEIKGNLFAIGNTININGQVKKDAFIIGNTVTIDEKAIIGKDLAFGGNTLQINGKINRNVWAGCSIITISNFIGGNLKINTSSIKVSENADIEGKLIYNAEKEINIENKETIKGGIEFNKIQNNKGKNTIKEKFYSWTIGLIQFILIGIILILIMPKYFQKLSEIITKNTFKSAGIGIIIFAIIPVIFFITLITIIGIPLSMILLGLIILFSYLAKFWCAYALGKYIIKNKYSAIISLILGAIILQTLFIIPIIGFLTKLIIIFIGLGSIYLSKPFDSINK